MTQDVWKLCQDGYRQAAGVTLDLSRLEIGDDYFAKHKDNIDRAFRFLREIEAGLPVNKDEGRMVGHYWLRAPELAPDQPADPEAPSESIREAIEGTLARLKAFAAGVHGGSIRPEKTKRFRNVLLVGIGGSALGPQFVSGALRSPSSPVRTFFFDNTDPDGFDRVLTAIGKGIAETLTIVVSKSGGTKETRNGMVEARRAYEKAGLQFGRHAVAITCRKSALDALADEGGWLERFPMWDWVGGRTSELSAVGLLPALLEGIDVDSMLAGAREMDQANRETDPRRNLGMLLALAWHKATGGAGKKDMVVLPYKDRLLLLSRYLQQLIMESLGKKEDLDGKVVHQGITVYGNKGSTDQHSYIQQLRDGVANFFVTFIEVLKDREGPSRAVEDGATSGDYLLGFLLGTRQALHEGGRESITLTIDEISPRSIGAIIALYERAVGYYAGLVNINAYHQPGVQAGKIAADHVLHIQRQAVRVLQDAPEPLGAEAIARSIPNPVDKGGKEIKLDPGWKTETVYKILEHLAANSRGVAKTPGEGPASHRYRKG